MKIISNTLIYCIVESVDSVDKKNAPFPKDVKVLKKPPTFTGRGLVTYMIDCSLELIIRLVRIVIVCCSVVCIHEQADAEAQFQRIVIKAQGLFGHTQLDVLLAHPCVDFL